jgi:hypothetical protein
VTFIDTPGFDDGTRDDGEILNLIGTWLGISYGRNELLSGVIFLHRITDNKVGGAGWRTLETLKKICGSTNYRNIALVTTMWDELAKLGKEELGRNREEQLRQGNDFWARMVSGGAESYRHYGKKDAALDIVRKFLPRRPVPLEIQNQLSSNDTAVGDTTAGKFITEYLQRQKKVYLEHVQNASGPFELDSEGVVTILADQYIKMEQDIANLRKTVNQIVEESRAHPSIVGKEEGENRADAAVDTDSDAEEHAQANAGPEASKAVDASDIAKTEQTVLPVRVAKTVGGPVGGQPKGKKTFLQKIRDMVTRIERRKKPN